jgi:hypothetical protein
MILVNNRLRSQHPNASIMRHSYAQIRACTLTRCSDSTNQQIPGIRPSTKIPTAIHPLIRHNAYDSMISKNTASWNLFAILLRKANKPLENIWLDDQIERILRDYPRVTQEWPNASPACTFPAQSPFEPLAVATQWC